MPDRKHRKSAAAMMMVAGGLVAAVAAPIGSALAQEADTGQGATEVLCSGAKTEVLCDAGKTAITCNGILSQDFLVAEKKLFLIGKDGTKTLAADGQWKTPDGKVIIVQKGIIVSE